MIETIPTIIPKLTRRSFLRVGSASVSCFYLLPMAQPLNVQAAEKVKLLGSAEYCIFFFMQGGPSQIDTFDFKEGRWTPPEFDLRTIKGGPLKLPYALFPRLAEKMGQISLVRSVAAWEAAHPRAQYYMQVAHPISPARFQEIPSIGSVIAYEMKARRKESDFLPPYVCMDYGTGAGAGFPGAGCLDAQCNPLMIETAAGVDIGLSEAERQSYDRRWNLMNRLEQEGQSGEALGGQAFEEFRSHYQSAHSMIVAPGIKVILKLNEEERKTYGVSAVGDACILTRNLLAAEAGTRYVFISHNGWDHHKDIYGKELRERSHEFDVAFSHLLTDLQRLKSKDGSSLLEKTLIVCMGEFGRTVGELTGRGGRDHLRDASTALFAGGGVKGGRIIGATDATGGKVVDPGWSKKRSIYIEDVAATIYSALGIDYTKKITNTPSGRAFEYLELFSGTTFLGPGEIAPLFS